MVDFCFERREMKSNLVELPGIGNYALILPGQINYGLEVSSKKELDDWVKEIEASWKVEPNQKISESVSEIGIIATFDCNLGCIYCYARGGESHEVMLFTTAIEAVKYIHNKERREKLVINLVGGGEPLLYLDLVKDIVEYAKGLFNEVEVRVVTNTTFGKDVLDWIVANRVVVSSSYDGVMQDKQRPYRNGTSNKKTVMKNIRSLVEASNPVSVTSVVTAEGVGTLRQTLDEVVGMGIETIEFEAARRTGVSRDNGWNEPNPVEFAKALLDVIDYAAQQSRKIHVLTGFFSIPRVGGSYCGVSGKNMIVTPTGLITACLDVSRATDLYANKIIYGEMKGDTILENSESKAFLSNFDNLEVRGCISCNLRMICQGGCPMTGLWEGGVPVGKSLYTCTFEHYFLPRLLLAMAENPDVVSVVAGKSEYKC